MTDLENRLWLCEQVLEVKQQGGMSPERALAMLHKLTDLESFEPYLSDQLPVPAVTWDYGEPLVDEHVEVLGLAHAAVDMATHQWSTDGYFDLEDDLDDERHAYTDTETRHCPICDNELERRPRESFAEFARRETDSKSCAGQLRSRRNREKKSAESPVPSAETRNSELGTQKS